MRFNIFVPELGTWFEGRRRYDGIVDLENVGYVDAVDEADALKYAKRLGYKAPIVSPAHSIYTH